MTSCVPKLARALITGISGQDGTYLAELLLSKGYEVHGFTRANDRDLPSTLQDRVQLQIGDLADSASISAAVAAAEPDEIYHLAAQTDVQASFSRPEETADITAVGTLRLLEAVRSRSSNARVFIAASSEIFGVPDRLPQDESSPIQPINPYAAAKAYAFHLAGIYRRAHGMFVSAGILFNHESPRRPSAFVTQKIVDGAVRIAAGMQEQLRLGSLEARRDWGYAGDYVDAMWRTLAHSQPDDFVIATGESHSVREFCEAAFSHVELDYRKYVVTDPSFVRAADVPETRGNPAKARRVLGWTPRVGFKELVEMMVGARLKLMERVR